jgi:hypothetical protein
MARIRTIKPEFWTDEKVVALPALARLLFIGMWNFVDDEGRAEFSPLRLKMQILPADDADISELIGAIRREGLIEVYVVEDKEYFQVKGFDKHQKIDARRKSKYPPAPICAELRRTAPTEGIKERDQGKESNSPNGECRPGDDADLAFDAYNSVAEEAGWPVAQAFHKQRKAKLRARLKDCGGLEGWRGAMARARASPFLLGDTGGDWRPNIDFFLQAKSFTKLMEGSYDKSHNAKPKSGHDAQLAALAEIYGPDTDESRDGVDVTGLIGRPAAGGFGDGSNGVDLVLVGKPSP